VTVKVLFINQFFWPDVSATAQLLTDLASDLTRENVSVTVVTGRRAYGDTRELGPSREVHCGVQILRVGGGTLHRVGVWSRYRSYLSFWVTASLRCLMLSSHDVVVPLTTPPLLSCLASTLKWVKGSRMICWCMDVYPDLGVLLGALRKGGVTFRILDRLSRWSMRRADCVVALGVHMADKVAAKGLPRERIRVLPVWENVKEDASGNWAEAFRGEHDLDRQFVVLYSGNMGVAHEFDAVVQAADILQDAPEIVFLMIGGGPRRGEVESQVRERGLSNVRFLPYQPREALQQSLAAGDVHLVTLRAGFEGLLVPSKFVGALRVGRPLVFVGPKTGEIPDAIAAGKCGVVIEPGDGKGLAAAILRLKEDKALREEMGRNAKALFEREYTREKVTAKFIELIKEVAARQ